jgi:serine/threonine protein kinase
VCPLDLSHSPVQQGEILAGKYRVEKVLGAGGMGIVVAATHLALGTRVAIKFLLPATCETPEAVARFLREARAAARIEGEHVARVTDVATLESGAPYMVMELLRGSDLAAHLKKNGPLAPETAVEFVLQACEAIAEAHAMGIVHRDLKPSNLFLASRPDGTPLVKVLDFGISKALDTARVSLLPGSATAPNSSFGSPLYMSPEQIASASQVDHRTDVWALGIVLHELVSGHPPFVRETLPALYVAITHDPAPPLRGVRPEVPAALEAAVLGCLEKKVGSRIQSIAALARALATVAPASARVSIERIERLAIGPSALATTNEPPSRVDEIGPTQLDPAGSGSDRGTGSPRSWGSTGGKSGKSGVPRSLVWLGGAALVVLGALLVSHWMSGSRVSPAVTSPTPPASVAASVPPSVAPPPSVSAIASGEPEPLPSASASAHANAGASANPVLPASAKARPPPGPRDTKRDASVPGHDGLDDRN